MISGSENVLNVCLWLYKIVLVPTREMWLQLHGTCQTVPDLCPSLWSEVRDGRSDLEHDSPPQVDHQLCHLVHRETPDSSPIDLMYDVSGME